jgi:hypothetical protein
MRGRRRRVELAAVPPEAGVGVGVGVGRGFIGEEDLGVGLLGVEEHLSLLNPIRREGFPTQI